MIIKRKGSIEASDDLETLHTKYTLPREIYQRILSLDEQDSLALSEATQLLSKYDRHAFDIWKTGLPETAGEVYMLKELCDLIIIKYEDMYGITSATEINASSGSPEDFEHALHDKISQLEGGIVSAENITASDDDGPSYEEMKEWQEWTLEQAQDMEDVQSAIYSCPDGVLEDELQRGFWQCEEDGDDLDMVISYLSAIADDYMPDEPDDDDIEASSGDINNTVSGPQTIDDLVGLAVKNGLSYNFDEAGNLIVFDEIFDPHLAGLEDGYGPNINSFFDEASQNPSFHYEDYDGEFGVGFKGIQGIADIQRVQPGITADYDDEDDYIDMYDGDPPSYPDVDNSPYSVGDMFESTGAHPSNNYSFEIIDITDNHVEVENVQTGARGRPIPKDIFDQRWDCGYYTQLKDITAVEGEYYIGSGIRSPESIMAADVEKDRDYLERLAKQTVDEIAARGFQAGYQIQPDENYLYFEVFDADDNVITEYLQLIDDIDPIEEDLADDVDKLATAIMEDIGDKVISSITASVDPDDTIAEDILSKFESITGYDPAMTMYPPPYNAGDMIFDPTVIDKTYPAIRQYLYKQGIPSSRFDRIMNILDNLIIGQCSQSDEEWPEDMDMHTSSGMRQSDPVH